METCHPTRQCLSHPSGQTNVYLLTGPLVSYNEVKVQQLHLVEAGAKIFNNTMQPAYARYDRQSYSIGRVDTMIAPDGLRGEVTISIFFLGVSCGDVIGACYKYCTILFLGDGGFRLTHPTHFYFINYLFHYKWRPHRCTFSLFKVFFIKIKICRFQTLCN